MDAVSVEGHFIFSRPTGCLRKFVEEHKIHSTLFHPLTWMLEVSSLLCKAIFSVSELLEHFQLTDRL